MEDNLYERVWRERRVVDPHPDQSDYELARSARQARSRRAAPDPSPAGLPEAEIQMPSGREDATPRANLAQSSRELERRMAGVIRSSVDQVEASLSQKLDFLESRMQILTTFAREGIERSEQQTQADLSLRLQPGDRDVVIAGMVKLIDDRLGSGPIAELNDRMNHLAAALGQTWRQAMAQNTEDQLKVVEILESKLEPVVEEMKTQATRLETAQSRISSELLSGFSNLAARISDKLRNIELQLEQSLEEQRRNTSSVLSSVEAMVQSLDKFLTWEMDARRRQRAEPI